jgi:acetyl esterase
LNRAFSPLESRLVDVCAVRIPIDGGTIGARSYRPIGLRGAAPLIVYFHGGGFVTGDLDGYDGLMRLIAARGGVAVLAVDYRLGPEDRFPRAHEDGFAAFAWAQRAAHELTVDPRRIAVAGDSAGGGIAAAVGAFASERGLATPAYQLLIYPAVDATGAAPSRARFTSGVPLTPDVIAWFVRHYARSPDDLGLPLFAPLRADSLAASPPTYLLAAGFDPLVDEGRLYAERLRAEEVRATYDLRPALAHGFVNLAGVVPDARRALVHAVAVTAASLRS